jgi:hypothetical protein
MLFLFRVGSSVGGGLKKHSFMILDLVEDLFFALFSFQVHVAFSGLFEWE